MAGSRHRSLSPMLIAICATALLFPTAVSEGSELWIGKATADITPDGPVPLTGYRSVRISRSVHSRCTANVLALEARDGEKVVDQAILVSCENGSNLTRRQNMQTSFSAETRQKCMRGEAPCVISAHCLVESIYAASAAAPARGRRLFTFADEEASWVSGT